MVDASLKENSAVSCGARCPLSAISAVVDIRTGAAAPPNSPVGIGVVSGTTMGRSSYGGRRPHVVNQSQNPRPKKKEASNGIE